MIGTFWRVPKENCVGISESFLDFFVKLIIFYINHTDFTQQISIVLRVNNNYYTKIFSTILSQLTVMDPEFS